MNNTVLIITLICLIIAPVIVYIIQRYNLEYYKKHGRTEDEIHEHLKRWRWYHRYATRVREYYTSLYENADDMTVEERKIAIFNEVADFVLGKNDVHTISSAFEWGKTEEGSTFWGKEDKKFLLWYFGQYVDFHIVKPYNSI